MGRQFSVSIREVIDLLGLERNPRERDGVKFNVRCPFCGDKGYHMNINTEMNVYRCVLCSGEEINLGVLDLYGRVALGTPLIPGPNGNSKEIFRHMKKALGQPFKRVDVQKLPEIKEIEPASDERLDAAYSALLSLPILSLSEAHRENLRNRGLTDEDIDRNGYASAPPTEELIAKDSTAPKARELLSSVSREERQLWLKHMPNCRGADIVAGMVIANRLRRQKVDLRGVPGFFYIKSARRWCFRYVAGMLIPTRAHDGHIVGLQVRRDIVKREGLRYLTVSSKGLPGGVTTRIARMHAPLSNTALSSENAEVIITEGPLKADTAVSLLFRLDPTRNVAFYAMQGVNSTAQLPELIARLKAANITRVKVAFDMDKCTNVHVMRASRMLRRKLSEANIQMATLCWDYDAAQQKYLALAELCDERTVDYTESEDLFVSIANMALALFAKGIDPNEGQPEKWPAHSKGIDDYLLHLLSEARR